jgi:hypothetical protein
MYQIYKLYRRAKVKKLFKKFDDLMKQGRLSNVVKAALPALMLVIISTPVNATPTRFVDQWAYTKDNKLVFMRNGEVLKMYEPLHCPVEKLEKILQSPTVDLYVHGTRLKPTLRVSHSTRETSIHCTYTVT